MDPRRLLPALAAVACACVVATLVVTLVPRSGRHPAGDAARPVSVAAPGGSGPARVLAAWDERRAAAWAAGDVRALAALYAAGSRSGAADVRLVRRYRERGLTVVGLTTQVLAMDVVSASPARLVLVVTDRVVGGRAIRGGSAPLALPADLASTRRVVLRREAGRWVVVEAQDQASAAASTLRTSSSSKS